MGSGTHVEGSPNSTNPSKRYTGQRESFWAVAEVAIAATAGALTFGSSITDLTGIAAMLPPEAVKILVGVVAALVGARVGLVVGKRMGG